jgi:4-amino-4-deoxy-L-arabinose transferase-like glycosyltransferase
MRISPLVASVAAGLLTAVVMLASEPHLAIVWDEGYTLGRDARLREWFRALADPAGFAARWRPPTEELVQVDGRRPPRGSRVDTRWKLLFDRRVVEWFWPFARAEPHGHPPFYALMGLAGDVLAPSWADLPRARLGPILLFSFTSGAIFHFVTRRWGHGPAIAATGAWVFQPNLFAHGHYATCDGILTSLWALAIFTFVRAVEVVGSDARSAAIRWSWTAVLGVLLGCAAATKLTGWFLPLPFAAWAVWYRDRRALKMLSAGLLVAMAVLLMLIPPWWTDPIGGLNGFFRSNLTRGERLAIPVQFLHAIYVTPNDSLPWYNTIVWTVLVTPIGFLVLGIAGFASAVVRRRSDPIGLLIAGHWALLMLLRAMPHVPGHDGVRLFLPAFGLLALLGGVGGRWLLDRSPRWGTAAIVAALAEGVVSLAVMMPVPLSYFSPTVGGLPGATALGMEPTYYWDALSPEARRWLVEHTPEGNTIRFANIPRSWLYLRRTGDLPRRLVPFDEGDRLWYVLQNRPGLFSPTDRALAREGRAAFVVTKFGVPLVWIFPYAEYRRLDL